jgi:hypothetical protein
MLDELRLSSEPKYLVDAAMKYLRGLKGHLVQNKRLARQRADGTLPSNGNPGGVAAMYPNAGLSVVNGNGMYPPFPAGSGGVGQQQQPVQGSEAWNQMSVEDRLQGALAGFGQ